MKNWLTSFNSSKRQQYALYAAMCTKFTGAKMHKQVTDWLSDYNRLCLVVKLYTAPLIYAPKASKFKEFGS